jgi:hypothetical protein
MFKRECKVCPPQNKDAAQPVGAAHIKFHLFALQIVANSFIMVVFPVPGAPNTSREVCFCSETPVVEKKGRNT